MPGVPGRLGRPWTPNRSAEPSPTACHGRSRTSSGWCASRSIGHPGYDPAHVRASAEATADIMRAAGVRDAAAPRARGRPPGRLRRDPWSRRRADGAPVRPPRRAARGILLTNGRVPRSSRSCARALYGRGAADDKSGVVVHAAALRALGVHEGEPAPVTVRVARGRRGRVLNRPSAGARAGPCRPAPSRRGRDRGRRQRPQRRPHDRHQRAWGHRLPRHRRGPADRAAQRLLRRPDPRRHHGAESHDRLPARRPRRGRDRGACTASSGTGTRSPKPRFGRSRACSTASR